MKPPLGICWVGPIRSIPALWYALPTPTSGKAASSSGTLHSFSTIALILSAILSAMMSSP
eukprot:scaffold2261_cov405-Prasinococcus_capsulatus_cf.AAC.9